MDYTITFQKLEHSGAEAAFITLEHLMNPCTQRPVRAGLIMPNPRPSYKAENVHQGMMELINSYKGKMDIAMTFEYAYECSDDAQADRYMDEIIEASKGNDMLIETGTFVVFDPLTEVSGKYWNDTYAIHDGDILYCHTKWQPGIRAIDFNGLKIAIVICSERDLPYEAAGIHDADLSLTVASSSIGMDPRCLRAGGYGICSDYNWIDCHNEKKLVLYKHP